jgi:hypothetical protein
MVVAIVDWVNLAPHLRVQKKKDGKDESQSSSSSSSSSSSDSDSDKKKNVSTVLFTLPPLSSCSFLSLVCCQKLLIILRFRSVAQR